ncbi:MAG: glycosyltransferase N-terminal domain-containing protein [Gemmatimonadaceae bacterium]
MHPVLGWVYEGAGQALRALAQVAPAGGGKVRRSLHARRGILERYRRWGKAGRNAGRPLVWIHAPSVGEGLQARPILELLRRELPHAQLAYTFFSPSAAAFAGSLDVDFRDYLPFDTAGDARAALESLRPSALVFSKLDLWPTLVAEAVTQRVRIGLVSATVTPMSSRRSRLATALLRDGYAALDAVGAVSVEDAARLMALGVRPSALSVTGDTRYDQVWARAEGVDRTSPMLAAFTDGRPTVVAGSTWPADERVLLPAIRDARRVVPRLRVIVAPHEPTPAHASSVREWAHANDMTVASLDAPGASAADVVLVERLGVLGDLYAVATVAYVGGGFHTAGLHSVLEPAAFGVPVVTGPRYQGSRDAVALVGAGGAMCGTDAIGVTSALVGWLTDDYRRRVAGGQGRTLVETGLGASARSVALIERLVAGP